MSDEAYFEQPTDGATPDTCPHELSGRAAAAGLRRVREGEQPSHVTTCVRCETKLYVVLDPASRSIL